MGVTAKGRNHLPSFLQLTALFVVVYEQGLGVEGCYRGGQEMKFSSWMLLISGLAIIGVAIWGYYTSSFPAPLPARNRAVQAVKTTPATGVTPVQPQVNKAFAFGDIEYTISNVEHSTSVSKPGASITTTGSFVRVSINVENLGERPVVLQAGDFALVDSQGRYYSVHQAATTAAAGDSVAFFSEALQPGLIHAGVIVFEVPKDTGGLTLRLLNGYAEVDLGQ